MLRLGFLTPLGRWLRRPHWLLTLAFAILAVLVVVLTRASIVAAGFGAIGFLLLGGWAWLGRLWAWSREHSKAAIPIVALLVALGLWLGDVWGRDQVEPFVARQRTRDDLTGQQLTTRFVTASNQVAASRLRVWGVPPAVHHAAGACDEQLLPSGFRGGQLLPVPGGRPASQVETTGSSDLVDLSAGPFAVPAQAILRIFRRLLPITPHRFGGRLSYSGDRAELTVYLTGGARLHRAGRNRWSISGPPDSIDEMIELLAVWSRLELNHGLHLEVGPLINALASRAVEDGAHGRAASFFALLTESDPPWGDPQWLPQLAAVLRTAGQEAKAKAACRRYEQHRQPEEGTESATETRLADTPLGVTHRDLAWSDRGLVFRRHQRVVHYRPNGEATPLELPGEVSTFLFDGQGSVLAVSRNGELQRWSDDGTWQELSFACAPATSAEPAAAPSRERRFLRQFAGIGSLPPIDCLLDERGSLHCVARDEGGTCEELPVPGEPAAARQVLAIGGELFLLALDGGVWKWSRSDGKLAAGLQVPPSAPTREFVVAAKTGTIYLLYESGNVYRCSAPPCPTVERLNLVDSGTGTRQILVTPDDRYLYVLKNNGDLWRIDHPAQPQETRFYRIYRSGLGDEFEFVLAPRSDGGRPTVYLRKASGEVHRLEQTWWRFWEPLAATPLPAAGG